MIRARLWYGPAGHGVGMDRVARYLRGPLACEIAMQLRPHSGRWVDEIEMRGPLSACLLMRRAPEVSSDAWNLARRLPPDAPKALRQRLTECTARLDICDLAGARPFTPASGVGRSILTPLAFALGGIVEEVDSRRLRFPPLPEPEGGYRAFLRSLGRMLEVVRPR